MIIIARLTLSIIIVFSSPSFSGTHIGQTLLEWKIIQRNISCEENIHNITSQIYQIILHIVFNLEMGQDKTKGTLWLY